MSSNNSNTVSALTKKDIDGVYWRWFFGSQICWNYETMQSGGIILALGLALRKIYKDDEEYKKVLNSHFSFFNTQPWMGGSIIGAALAIEEQHTPGNALQAHETSASLKTALMGPFAGVGDATFFVIPITILGAIISYMALEGSTLGFILAIIWSVLMLFLRKKMFDLGHSQGIKFITSMGDQIKLVTNSISILGIAVVGALIASNVNVTSPFTFTSGEVSIGLQVALDMIMPKLLPAVITGLAYYLLGKMSSTKVIFIILVLSIVCGALNILA